MEITHGWARKRTAHRGACWECHRCHRACDGERPCKRCINLGRGYSCRDSAPNERIVRKRKKPKPNELKSEEDPPQRHCLHKMPKRSGFFTVNPQMFYGYPSLQEETDDSTHFVSPLSGTSSSRSTETYGSLLNPDRLNETHVEHQQLIQNPTPFT